MNYKDKKWNDFDVSYLKTFEKDVMIISPSVYREYRGEIFTTYHSFDHPVSHYINTNPPKLCIQGRFSKSYKGVLRGLHYDDRTWKLVQAVVGDIYLVIVDMRKESSTYRKWESYILTERTREQILIPPYFANGHYALTDCIFHYNLFYSGNYVDETEQKVIKWNDPLYKIEWPTNNPILQNRDK